MEKLIEYGSLFIKPYFMDAGLHFNYDELEKQLTRALGQCSKDKSRGTVVVYGDLCHPQIKELIGAHDSVAKVNALNCIDCLLGGHGKLLEIDSNSEYFYLSPGWMPSNLKESPNFKRAFNLGTNEMKKLFSGLNGIILLDSLGNLSEFKDEIEEFCEQTGLTVLDKKEVGLTGLEHVILEAIQKLK